MEETIKKCKESSRNFDKLDFVILLCSPWDVKRGKIIRKSSLNELKGINKSTNLIVIGTPFQRNRDILNSIIEEQNMKLSAFHASDNTDAPVFVPLALVIDEGTMDIFQKERLVKYNIKYVLQSKIQDVNSIEIETHTQIGMPLATTGMVHSTITNVTEAVTIEWEPTCEIPITPQALPRNAPDDIAVSGYNSKSRNFTTRQPLRTQI